MDAKLILRTRTDLRYRVEREEWKKVPIFQEEKDLPRKSTLILLFFKYVWYATKDQLLRWGGLPPNSRTLKWLYLHAYLDGGRLSSRSPFFFWIDKKGAALLQQLNIANVPVPTLTLRTVQHSLGVAESLLNEIRYGYTALSTEFVLGAVRPDIYIERKADIYFIEFDTGTEKFTQLKKKFEAYAGSDYVQSTKSHIHIYYAIEDSRKVIEDALRTSGVSKAVQSIKIGRLDMEKVLKSEAVRRKMALAT